MAVSYNVPWNANPFLGGKSYLYYSSLKKHIKNKHNYKSPEETFIAQNVGKKK